MTPSTPPPRAKPKNSKPTALQKQANATRRMANESDSHLISRELVYEAVATIEDVQRRLDRRTAAAAASPVLVISPDATPAELRHARIRRAVSKGKSVYLPYCKDFVSGLPNAFLRSALFSVTGPVNETLVDQPISAPGDISITLTGRKLVDYDRQVFAAVLSYYSDRPLADRDTDSEWIKVSFWNFASAMGLASGASVHKAIRESLVRLNAAQMRLRINRRDILLPHIVEVIFNEVAPAKVGEVRARSDFQFCVRSEMAELYGPHTWTKVPVKALSKYSGLVRWLAAFYRTHGEAYSLKVSQLHQLSGSTCALFEFRRRLKVGLTKLKGAGTPAELLVSDFTLDADTDKLIVHLSRWSQPPQLS